jgi:hypothetical protein
MEMDAGIEFGTDNTFTWTEGIEELLENWRLDSLERSEQHSCRSKEFRKCHVLLTIPTIVLPIAMASFSQMYSVCTHYEAQILNSLTYLFSGSIASIAVFLNNGQLFERHNQAESMFLELSHEIKSVLVRPRSDRPLAILVLSHVRHRYERLLQVSPDVNTKAGCYCFRKGVQETKGDILR